MLDNKTFRSELERIEGPLKRCSMGGHKGYSYLTETPSHRFHVLDLFVLDMGFVHLIARDSFDQALAKQLVTAFNRTRIKRYKSDELRVCRADGLDRFDCIGLAPPKMARLYKGQSPTLSKHGYWLFPMYGYEFLDGFSADQFWTQIRRRDKWCATIVDWNRRFPSV